MFYLFTTPTCPNCPRAKDLLVNHENVSDLEIIDASTPDGLRLARNFNISQVPSLVEMNTDEEPENIYSGLSALLEKFSS